MYIYFKLKYLSLFKLSKDEQNSDGEKKDVQFYTFNKKLEEYCFKNVFIEKLAIS